MTGELAFLGDKLINGKGETIDVAKIEGNPIMIYFSAHWCPPCRGFTPRLIKAYSQMKQNGIKFELVFVSSDEDQSAFDKYLGTMPWYAVPFDKRSLKDVLSKKFRVQGIPTLVVIDEKGELITDTARSNIIKDPTGTKFPWHPIPIMKLLDGTVAKGDKSVSLKELQQNKCLAIYFSAHWCGPCQAFTPQLIKWYNELKKKGLDFEIIFVSSDRDEDAFAGYYGSMPWLALSYDAKDEKNELSQKFGVRGIPSLIFVDPADKGSVINKNGRSIVASDPEGKDFPWYPKPLKALSQDNAETINESPCLHILAEKQDQTTQAKLKAMANTVATEFVTQFKKDKKSVYPLNFFFGTNNMCSTIRKFSKAPEGCIMVITDIPGGMKFLCKDMTLTEDIIRAFAQDYILGKLDGTEL